MERENFAACPFCFSSLPENEQMVLDYCVNCCSEFKTALRVVDWKVESQQPIVKNL